MSDIVERLRERARLCEFDGAAMREAAAELERLQRMWGEACKDYGEAKAEIERLRAFAESVRNWKRLPLWELTDTDHERASAFRRQLEIHAEAARKALEGK